MIPISKIAQRLSTIYSIWAKKLQPHAFKSNPNIYKLPNLVTLDFAFTTHNKEQYCDCKSQSKQSLQICSTTKLLMALLVWPTPTTLAKKLKVIAIFLMFNEYLGKSLNLLWQIFFAIWTHFYCCILNKQSRLLVTLTWYCMKHLHLLFNHLSV